MNPLLLTCRYSHLSQKVVRYALVVVAFRGIVVAVKARHPLDAMQSFVIVEANFVAAETSSTSSVRASSVSASNLVVDIPLIEDKSGIQLLIAQANPIL